MIRVWSCEPVRGTVSSKCPFGIEIDVIPPKAHMIVKVTISLKIIYEYLTLEVTVFLTIPYGDFFLTQVLNCKHNRLKD